MLQWRRAIELDPNRASTHRLTARLLAKLERHREAIGYWREVVRITPDDHEAHAGLGFAHQALGVHVDAVASFREAIRRQSQDPLYFVGLGTSCHAVGSMQESVEALERATQLDPDCAPAHNTLCVDYKDLGRLKEASGSIRQAIRLKP